MKIININTQIGESLNLSDSECQCVPGLLQQTKPHFVLHRHRKSEMGKEQMLQNEMIPFEFVRKLKSLTWVHPTAHS